MLSEIPPNGSMFSLVTGFQPVRFSKNELIQENSSNILPKLSESVI